MSRIDPVVLVYFGAGFDGFLRRRDGVGVDVDERRVLDVAGRMDDARIDFRLDVAEVERREVRRDDLHAAGFDFHGLFDVVHQVASCKIFIVHKNIL